MATRRPLVAAAGQTQELNAADELLARLRTFDDTDPTRQAVLDLSGLTTGTTRTLKLPDASGTLALLDVGQTFTGSKQFNGTTTLNAPWRQLAATVTAASALTVNSNSRQLVDATAGAFALTLPTTTSVGLVYEISKVDATTNAVTLAGGTIGGLTGYALTHPGQTVRVESVSSGVWRLLTPIGPLYTHAAFHQVAQTTAEVSAIGTGKGYGSMTLPAGFWTPGRRVKLFLKGSYQTPALPDAVTVRVKLDTTLLARAAVAASIFAASSTVNALYGEAVITCHNISGATARLVCDGFLQFQTGMTGVVTVPFSTAMSAAAGTTVLTPTAGTSGPTATVDVAASTAALLDITEQWGGSQNGQGTVISSGRLLEAA